MPSCFILKGKFDPAKPEWLPDLVLTEQFQDHIKGVPFEKLCFMRQELAYMTNEIFMCIFEHKFLPHAAHLRRKGRIFLAMDCFAAHVQYGVRCNT